MGDGAIDLCRSVDLREEESLCGSGALKPNPNRNIFHATLHVTRVEEWWSIEAESVEEARQLLNDGQGERSHVGQCIYCEVVSVEE